MIIRAFLTSGLACFLASSSQLSGATTKSSEMPVEMKACIYVATAQQRVCPVTFIELASNPKDFDGQYIRITGFALDEHGFTYLYASKDAYVYGAARGGVDLLIPEDLHSKFSVTASDTAKPVTVIGKFNLLRGRLPESIGMLSGPGLSFYVDNFPWEAPALPPPE